MNLVLIFVYTVSKADFWDNLAVEEVDDALFIKMKNPRMRKRKVP